MLVSFHLTPQFDASTLRWSNSSPRLLVAKWSVVVHPTPLVWQMNESTIFWSESLDSRYSWAFLGRIKPHRGALANSDMLRNCGSPHICCYPTINGCPPKRCQTWIHVRHHAFWTPKRSLKTLSQNLRGFGGVIFLICVQWVYMNPLWIDDHPQYGNMGIVVQSNLWPMHICWHGEPNIKAHKSWHWPRLTNQSSLLPHQPAIWKCDSNQSGSNYIVSGCLRGRPNRFRSKKNGSFIDMFWG